MLLNCKRKIQKIHTFFNFKANRILCCLSNWLKSCRFSCDPRRTAPFCCLGALGPRLLDRDLPRAAIRVCDGFFIIENRSFNVIAVVFIILDVSIECLLKCFYHHWIFLIISEKVKKYEDVSLLNGTKCS